MAHTNNWDETAPSNTTNAATIDSEITKLRKDVRERLAVDHDLAATDTAAGTEGQHKKVTIRQAIASPVLTGTQTCLFRKTGDPSCDLRNKCEDAVDHHLWSTGSVKMGVVASAPDGWLLLNGDTIGSAASGATHAGAELEDLYCYLWDNLANAQAPVSGGRGANAAADFTANKTLTIPDSRGRFPIGSGQGTGLSDRTIGEVDGDETKDLSHDHDLDAHTHTIASVGNHRHYGTSAGGGQVSAGGSIATPLDGSHAHGGATGSAGPTATTVAGSAVQDVMNPWIAVYFYIKA